ncbi:MAG: EpsG family protein [Lachnospiraceae bacterium]|nr:EpsG family protein [Lachnospiraceae bacterium]
MINICCLVIFTTLAALTVRPEIGRLYKSGFQGFNILIWIAAIWMSCLIGLRVEYNDTAAYISNFNSKGTILEMLKDSEALSWGKNPLFELYTTFIHSLTHNYHIYFMISAVFVVISFLKFFMQECEIDVLPYSIFLFFTFGTYFFSLAAMKQTIAMAILTYAIVALQKKQHLRFIIIVLLATLFHTYSILFLMLLLLNTKPWRTRTILIILATVAIMFTFKGTLTSILQYADSLGKDVAEEGLFNGAAMNTLRVAVYGITPVMLYLGNEYLEPKMCEKHYILIHMSILSFMFILLGSINGANLFGRMARYFEVGTIVMLPWAIKNMFNEKSEKLINLMMVILFFMFFMYDYQDFGVAYRSITIFEFLKGII